MNTTAQTGRSRRGRPGYDLESVLRVAVDLFNERGFEGTSVDELASRLGVTKSAIYHHVTSKQQLLRMAVDRALDGLFAVLAETSERDGPAIDALEHLVRGSVEVLVDQLPFVTLLLRIRGNTEVERNALARRREFDHAVTELVRRAEREGDVRPDVDPAITSRLLFGMVNSLIEWYRPRDDGNSLELVDAVCAVAFHGLRAR